MLLKLYFRTVNTLVFFFSFILFFYINHSVLQSALGLFFLAHILGLARLAGILHGSGDLYKYVIWTSASFLIPKHGFKALPLHFQVLHPAMSVPAYTNNVSSHLMSVNLALGRPCTLWSAYAAS